VEAVEAPSAAEVPPEQDLLARARRHPELQTLQAHETAARARADEERIAIRPLPTVSLTAERITSSTPPYWGLRTGVAFDIPLLSWNRGRVHEQEENARTAAVQAQAAMQRLTGQILAARARWAAASARARFYRVEFIPSQRACWRWQGKDIASGAPRWSQSSRPNPTLALREAGPSTPSWRRRRRSPI